MLEKLINLFEFQTWARKTIHAPVLGSVMVTRMDKMDKMAEILKSIAFNSE